jgi:nucleoside-diphosphate-sugar epimerase
VRATIVGAEGFIGRHLLTEFRRLGWSCFAVGRGYRDDLFEMPLGHVIYCAGVTTDFIYRPADTVTAHVTDLQRMIECGRMESLLYLSSTRVYLESRCTSELTSLTVRSVVKDHLYALSKLLGENICQYARVPSRIVRLSNVYGLDWDGPTFLTEMVRSAATGHIRLRSNPSSEKDYVSLEDVVALIPKIVTCGKHPIYNVASGRNVSHREIVGTLHDLTKCEVELDEGAEVTIFPEIETTRVRGEFDWQPRSLLTDLPDLLDHYRWWAGTCDAAERAK